MNATSQANRGQSWSQRHAANTAEAIPGCWSGAVHVFFPHAIGHMVGLGIRDAGEVLPGRDEPREAFPRLHVDLPLLPGTP